MQATRAFGHDDGADDVVGQHCGQLGFSFERIRQASGAQGSRRRFEASCGNRGVNYVFGLN
jgi:hypothetical protein